MENNNTPLNFWSQVWSEGTIRFHQKDYNSQMLAFFKNIDLKDKSVFIPLAGKTKDILYFLERGANVVAIEFVEQAVIDFFEDNEILYTKMDNLYQCENLKFYVMDFFDYKNEEKFDVIYDRASQVVFAKELRPAYYKHIAKLLDTHTTLLLAAIYHEGPEDYGPPFKISQSEVMASYKAMGINLEVFNENFEIASEKMQAAGIKSLISYFLTNTKNP